MDDDDDVRFCDDSFGFAGEHDDFRSCSGDDDFDVAGDASKRDFFTLKSNGVSSLGCRLTEPSDFDVDEFVLSSIELTGDKSFELGLAAVPVIVEF